jgi:hypothetical protein
VHNGKRTHVREGVAELGAGRSAWPIPWSVRPPFLEREDVSTLRKWWRRHSQGENHSPERPSTS